jgi:hypothetical protein
MKKINYLQQNYMINKFKFIFASSLSNVKTDLNNFGKINIVVFIKILPYLNILEVFYFIT